ncbi:MAG: hypothetical protein IPL19_01825 [Sandaracinaceae bacterium]|nr:hypothetical protein [Sandaracinaceae bacterium]MBP7685161.1 hypothetical protein [Deltaproteobacteria bacterium]
MSIRTTHAWMMATAMASFYAGCGSPGAPTDDAGAGTPCTSHADCDDELFCTGPELCMPNSPDALANGCLLGAPPCAAASCEEAADTCDTDCGDEDADGHTDAACGGDDCDDDDDQRFPGNAEVCDLVSHDEDCDPCTVGSLDADQDLFLSAVCANAVTEAPSPACGIGVVYDATASIVRGLDCNDATGMIKPGQAETCNGVDDDCDGEEDENLTLEPYWPDVDMDLAGDESVTPTQACARPEGFAASGGDCDDLEPTVRPFGTELCDGLDNDCDEETDEQSASYTFYRDADEDGVGNSAMPTTSTTCDPPTGYSALPGDCDDNAPLIYPGATERCDRIDNNCSQVVSPGGVATDEDVDDDGHAPVGATCSSTPVGTFPADDCDETNATIHGGAVEFCSAIDEDCDGETDETGADVCGRGDTCDEGCVSGQRLSVGDADACAVLQDGGLACWGGEGRDVPERVSGLIGVEQVASGSEHICVRLADRTVRCWGRNTQAQLGAGHALVTGSMITPLGLGEVLAVDAAQFHTCALKAGGEVWCWGGNDRGQLGLGHTTLTNAPTRVSGVEGAVQLEVHERGACVRTGTGYVYCWGDGPPGDGVTESSLVPVRSSLTGVLEVAADHQSTTACARRASGWSCWGRGNSAGTGTAGDVLTPTSLAVPGGALAIALSDGHGCALQAGGVACWGESSRANFAETVQPAAALPAPAAVTVPLTLLPTAIHCGAYVCCGLSGNQVTCWGSPDHPKLGDGPRDGTSPNTPVGLSNVTAMALGEEASCAIDDQGLQCWGSGGYAGFADGRTRYLPQPVGSSSIAQVAIGARRACSVDDMGTVRCWGDGAAGDVAETSGSPTPIVVDQSSMGPASQVVVGGMNTAYFSCALDLDGAPWCWGAECWDGSGDCSTPKPIGGGVTFTSLAAGGLHVCGVTLSGDLYCWGNGNYGQLGAGDDPSYTTTPVRVVGVGGTGFTTGVTHVAAGYWSTCARRSDGRVVCFGYGTGHILGNGSTAHTSTPILVAGLTDANGLVCSGSDCMARRADGTWVGWGGNSRTLGIAGASTVPTPAPAAFGLVLTDIVMASTRACGIDAAGLAHCWGINLLGGSSGNLFGFPLVTAFTLPPPI